MKKYLIIGLSIISSLFLVSNVKADDVTSRDYYLFEKDSTFFNNFDYSPEFIDTFSKQLIAKWEKNYKEDWPYYYISITRVYNDDSVDFSIALGMRKDVPIVSSDNVAVFPYGTYSDGSSYPRLFMFFKDSSLVSEEYTNGINTIPYLSWQSCSNGNNSDCEYHYYLFNYYDSNFDMLSRFDYTFVVKDIDGTELFSFNKGDIIPTYKDKFVDKIDLNYVEVDLNSYPYIILSLKDYSKTEEFSVINYVKGEYCLSAAYDYGLKTKEDYDSVVSDVCSPYYDVYTPVRTYVLKSDLTNHAIYYLKAHDTTKENKVKIDTSVFNIHYISEEEKDNPIITINGKKYSPKSYDNLPSDSIKNTEEENWPGKSEEFSITDIFTAPLEFFKKIINAISEFNGLIKELFSFLPDEFLAFLLAAFALLVVVAIVKILL